MGLDAIRADVAAQDNHARAADFASFARALVSTKGNLQLAEARSAGTTNSRVQTILRAASASGTTTDSVWASALLPYRTSSGAWLAELSSASCFDAMLGSMLQVPLQSWTVIVTTGATGAAVNEISMKPISEPSLTGATLEPTKASGMVIVSDELAKFGNLAANQTFNDMLRRSVARATDDSFLAEMIATNTPLASGGNSPSSAVDDIRSLLGALAYGSNARLYLVAEPARCLELATAVGSGGQMLFPTMTPLGGTVCGVTVLSSDRLPAGVVLALDASQILANGGSVLLDSTQQADLVLNTTPDSPDSSSTIKIGMWTSNLTCLRAERYFAAKVGRAAAVASMSGVNW